MCFHLRCCLQKNIVMQSFYCFYFQITSSNFIEIPAATRGVSPSLSKMDNTKVGSRITSKDYSLLGSGKVNHSFFGLDNLFVLENYFTLSLVPSVNSNQQ
jgi:hypothetical protein